ncbi:PAAR domain-containing protein [Wolbachia endosymbiont of Ctenocephalides felis wCfeT]|uniref:PAAR domain-containing protein n=1 Tax=Wolbachia endosymbiont of Ctenocephalides felis wCfeT TaxID=2732593 RepID=UPI00144593B1|nr:PAAR domain-containing protein [Wolbachia endosymbiont of Ctenocephalides felis wCfeT]
MSKGIVRLGDYCTEISPHFCIGGSNNVLANGYPVCRKGDNWSEGKKVIEGSKIVFANGYGIARFGDMVSCGFKVISGSRNVFVE